MESLQPFMTEYKKQLRLGVIQKAYRGLMEYIMDLKTYLNKKFPDYFVSGSIYSGYMDMTYFSFYPESLKKLKLKIAIVFNYDTFRFEVWLAGMNKQIQSKYWKLFRETGWDKYPLVSTPKDVDSIIEHTLVEDPDFSNLTSLTSKIESETFTFIKAIESFLV